MWPKLRRLIFFEESQIARLFEGHAPLLEQTTTANERRPRVISDRLYERLRFYLRFRHAFRHAYLFQLEWAQMKPLVLGLGETFEWLRSELGVFVADMDAKAGSSDLR